MTRTYELGLVIEPRQSDDKVEEIVAKYREMIEAAGGSITDVDNWGKRKLAYPIRNFTEGRYVFFFVSRDGAVHWNDIERNLMQNEQILRHLVVRTDEDLKRAETKGKKHRANTEADAEAPDEEQAEA